MGGIIVLAMRILVLLLLAGPLYAHNGAVAIAVPVEGIVVDGDLSDWPENLHKYPIEQYQHATLVDPRDFAAHFRVGYDPEGQAIYVAVEVTDDEAGDFDGCAFFIHPEHGAGPEGVISGSVYNGRSSIVGKGMTVAAKSIGTSRVYEWRYSMGAGRPVPDTVVGFDLTVYDQDPPEWIGAVTWFGINYNLTLRATMGDLLLTGTPSPLAGLTGQVTWDDATPIGRMLLGIESASTDFAMSIVTDREGRYDANLPLGRYTVTTGIGQDVISRVVDLKHHPTQVDFEVIYSGGDTVTAGPGTTIDLPRFGSWTSFAAEQGLPPGSISTILQDHAGGLLLGGAGRFLGFRGLRRYDGADFEPVGGPQDFVVAGVKDPDGDLWFGTREAGVSRFDGHNWHHYTQQEIGNDRVTCLAVDGDESIWLGTKSGVHYYDGRDWSELTIDGQPYRRSVHSLLATRSGDLWIGSADGLERYDGSHLVAVEGSDGVAVGPVSSLLEDRRGIVWIGGRVPISGYGPTSILRYDGTVIDSVSVSVGEVRVIAEDGLGRIWFGTMDGILRYDDGNWDQFRSAQGLVNDQIDAILPMPDGSVWIGAHDGLSRYDESILHLSTSVGLPSDFTFGIDEDVSGAIWIATGAGLSRYHEGKLTNFTSRDGLPHDRVYAVVAAPDGAIWVGCRGGIARFDGRQFRTYSVEDGLGSNLVNDLLLTQSGDLWASSWNNPVSRFDGNHFTVYTTMDGLTPATYALAEDHLGRLLLSGEGGTQWFDGRRFESLPHATFGKTGHVKWAFPDSGGVIWLAGGNGVYRVDPERSESIEGLIHESATFVLRSTDGSYWIGTWGGGINRYDGKVMQVLQRTEGLGSNSVQQILQARNGDIWVTSEGGVTRHRPGRTEPTVEVSKVIAERSHKGEENLHVRSTNSDVSFTFSGRSLATRPDRLKYRYRLVGQDDDWKTSSATLIEYQQLPFGDYRFEVVAVDPDLNYSAPAVATLTVVPPYVL